MMRDDKGKAFAPPMDGVTGAPSPAENKNAGARNGVAFVAFNTESPHASRGDSHLTDLARTLRRLGIPSKLFQVLLTWNGEATNRERVNALTERLIREGCKWAVFHDVWTPELGQRLLDAGIRIMEVRTHTFEPAVFTDYQGIVQHVMDCATGESIDDSDLVEIVGPQQVRPITAIDLRINQSCGFKGTLAENDFYQDVFDAPEVATHRGCGHCLNALPPALGTTEELAARIVERIRDGRNIFPSVETFWMSYAETFYDALSVAFRTTRGDAIWEGITLAMQCRPDVLAKRSSEIETLAADALACGTTLRIGVVGFENFSPREILVLNRGAAPELLDAAATILNRWLVDPPKGLIVRNFTPSFILFTPWTRVEDLEINLERIARHGLWNANIERLRVGPGTPAYIKAQRQGLVVDGPVRAAVHPNGYSSEREIRFVDPHVAATSTGFERLRAFAFSEQPELLTGVLATVKSSSDPAAIDWERTARTWEAIGTAAHAA